MKKVYLAIVCLLVSVFAGVLYAQGLSGKPSVQIYGEFKGGPSALIEVTPEMTVLDAIDEAGGFTVFSNNRDVILLPNRIGGNQFKRLDLRAAESGVKSTDNPEVEAGEIIVIRTKIIVL